jgi:NACHT N-terminal Helical domain 7
MSDFITYREALQILSGAESHLLTALDEAATAGLTAWATGSVAMGKDPTMILGLIEPKNDIVGYGKEIVRRVGDWRKGLSRYDRSERLAAAHAVLVVTSYFESLEAADLPIPFDEFGFTDGEKTGLALGRFFVNGKETQKIYATRYTLFAFAEFLCWMDILRQGISFLDLGDDARNRKLMNHTTVIRA